MTIKQPADAMQQPESSVLIAVLKMVREKLLSEPNAQGEFAYPGKQYDDDNDNGHGDDDDHDDTNDDEHDDGDDSSAPGV